MAGLAKRFPKSIHRILGGFINAVYPRLCLGCGKEGDVLCITCDRSFKTRLIERDHQISLCDYHDPIFGKLLHVWKFGFDDQAGQLLKILIDSHAKDLASWSRKQDIHAIVAIPSHETRVRERGFDQAKELAIELSAVLSIPVITPLSRRRYTGHQSKLNKLQRQKQMSDNPFTLITSNHKEVFNSQQYKNILLVDDVITTGSTMGAAEEILNHAGVEEVYRFSLAFAV